MQSYIYIVFVEAHETHTGIRKSGVEHKKARNGGRNPVGRSNVKQRKLCGGRRKRENKGGCIQSEAVIMGKRET